MLPTTFCNHTGLVNMKSSWPKSPFVRLCKIRFSSPKKVDSKLKTAVPMDRIVKGTFQVLSQFNRRLPIVKLKRMNIAINSSKASIKHIFHNSLFSKRLVVKIKKINHILKTPTASEAKNILLNVDEIFGKQVAIVKIIKMKQITNHSPPISKANRCRPIVLLKQLESNTTSIYQRHSKFRHKIFQIDRYRPVVRLKRLESNRTAIDTNHGTFRHQPFKMEKDDFSYMRHRRREITEMEQIQVPRPITLKTEKASRRGNELNSFPRPIKLEDQKFQEMFSLSYKVKDNRRRSPKGIGKLFKPRVILKRTNLNVKNDCQKLSNIGTRRIFVKSQYQASKYKQWIRNAKKLQKTSRKLHMSNTNFDISFCLRYSPVVRLDKKMFNF